MTEMNPSQPAILQPGLWTGEFYGKANGTFGSSVLLDRTGGGVKGMCYLVIPARLTPPASEHAHRSLVWIGAVSEQAKSDSVGFLAKDFDPRLLTLTLNVTFSEINIVIALLKERLVSDFQFEAVTSETEGDLRITGWSGSFAF